MLDLQGAHSVRGHDLLLDKLDLDHTIGLHPILRPVHVALAPPALHKIGDHHDDGHPLFPDHAPEAIEGVGQGTLGADEGMSLLVAINEVGIDIVQILLLSRCGMQMHPTVVICDLQVVQQ